MKIQPPQQVPFLGQQQQPTQAQVEAAVQQGIRQMSAGIYSQLATTYISHALERLAAGGADRPDVDAGCLRHLAKDSLTAAQCYFEGVGVLQTEGQDNGQSQADKALGR